MKVAIIFDNFGPYHLARLRAANQMCTLLALEVNANSRDYAWEPSACPRGFTSITLNQASPGGKSHARGPSRRLRRALVEYAPHCVIIPGWSRRYSLEALAWCRINRIPAVLMSESCEHDSPRTRWTEWCKARIVSRFSTALVGGATHSNYLANLGMTPDRVFYGYNAVDNEYFSRSTRAVREHRSEFGREFALPKKYFLASARFVEKKNLPRLVQAYATYRGAFADSAGAASGVGAKPPWSLVLLGDGPEKPRVQRLILDLALEQVVLLPGFAQYPQLPVYYGLASAFVLASTSEPWGLVVNEAMASGLPVLVSNRCGCAPELVREGRNGFTFDPWNVRQLADLMLRISTSGAQLSTMSTASAELISAWGPSRFAQGLRAAAEKAFELGCENGAVRQRPALRQLLRR